MGWKLSDIPGPANRDYAPVEQATAAPGEKRDLPTVCSAAVNLVWNDGHERIEWCHLPAGHAGTHSYLVG